MTSFEDGYDKYMMRLADQTEASERASSPTARTATVWFRERAIIVLRPVNILWSATTRIAAPLMGMFCK